MSSPCQIEDKVSSGSLQSPINISSPISPQASDILKDSLKEEMEDIFTGNYLQGCPESPLFGKSKRFLDPNAIQSYQDLRLAMNMSGKKILESKEPNLNLEAYPSGETKKEIGKTSGKRQRKVCFN